MNPDNLTPEEASAHAVHKAKSAAAAVELSREVQMQEAIQKTAEQTKQTVVEALKEVFGDGDENNPTQMKVLVRRIPILCTNIEAMHKEIANTREDVVEIKDNLKWGTRLVLGAVLLSLLGTVLIN